MTLIRFPELTEKQPTNACTLISVSVIDAILRADDSLESIKNVIRAAYTNGLNRYDAILKANPQARGVNGPGAGLFEEDVHQRYFANSLEIYDQQLIIIPFAGKLTIEDVKAFIEERNKSLEEPELADFFWAENPIRQPLVDLLVESDPFNLENASYDQLITVLPRQERFVDNGFSLKDNVVEQLAKLKPQSGMTVYAGGHTISVTRKESHYYGYNSATGEAFFSDNRDEVASELSDYFTRTQTNQIEVFMFSQKRELLLRDEELSQEMDEVLSAELEDVIDESLNQQRVKKIDAEINAIIHEWTFLLKEMAVSLAHSDKPGSAEVAKLLSDTRETIEVLVMSYEGSGPYYPRLLTSIVKEIFEARRSTACQLFPHVQELLTDFSRSLRFLPQELEAIELELALSLVPFPATTAPLVSGDVTAQLAATIEPPMGSADVQYLDRLLTVINKLRQKSAQLKVRAFNSSMAAEKFDPSRGPVTDDAGAELENVCEKLLVVYYDKKLQQTSRMQAVMTILTDALNNSILITHRPGIKQLLVRCLTFLGLLPPANKLGNEIGFFGRGIRNLLKTDTENKLEASMKELEISPGQPLAGNGTIYSPG